MSHDQQRPFRLSAAGAAPPGLPSSGAASTPPEAISPLIPTGDEGETPTRVIAFPFTPPDLALHCASRLRRMAGAMFAAGMDPFAENLIEVADWLDAEYQLRRLDSLA